MNIRRSIAIIAVIIGIVLVLVSMNINNRVQEGRVRVSSAQRKIDQGKQFFEITPQTKPVGKILTDSVQKKIDQGRQNVEKNQNLANWLQFGGIFLIILGVVLFFTGRTKRNS